MSDPKLTPKQEAFAQAIVKGMRQADAYRHAYNAKKMSDKTVHEAASRIASDSKVAARLAALRQPAVKKLGITLESHLEELDRLRQLAADARQYGAAITAEVARGKHSGVAAAEKRELTGAGGAPLDGGETATLARLAALISQAQARKDAQ